MTASIENAREAAFADVEFSEGVDCSQQIEQKLDSLRDSIQSPDSDLFSQPDEADKNSLIREKLNGHLAELSSIVNQWVTNSSTSIEVSDIDQVLQRYCRYVGSPEVFLAVKGEVIDRLEDGLKELGPLVEKHSPSFAAAAQSAPSVEDLKSASFTPTVETTGADHVSYESLDTEIPPTEEDSVADVDLPESLNGAVEATATVAQEPADEEPVVDEEVVEQPPIEEPETEMEPVVEPVQVEEVQDDDSEIEGELLHSTRESSFQRILNEIEPLTEQFRKEYEDLEARLHKLLQEGKKHTATESDLTDIERSSFRDAASRVKRLIYTVSEHYQGMEFDVEGELPLLLDFASVPVGFQPESFDSREFLFSLDGVAKSVGMVVCDQIGGGADIISRHRVHGRYGSRKRIHIRPHWLFADMNRLSLYVPRVFVDGTRHETMSLPLLQRSAIWNQDAKRLATAFAHTGKITLDGSYGQGRREILTPNVAE